MQSKNNDSRQQSKWTQHGYHQPFPLTLREVSGSKKAQEVKKLFVSREMHATQAKPDQITWSRSTTNAMMSWNYPAHNTPCDNFPNTLMAA